MPVPNRFLFDGLFALFRRSEHLCEAAFSRESFPSFAARQFAAVRAGRRNRVRRSRTVPINAGFHASILLDPGLSGASWRVSGPTVGGLKDCWPEHFFPKCFGDP